MAQSVLKRPSLRRHQQSTDGSTSPPANPSATPSSSFRGSSYFTSKAVKRAKKVSEESPVYPSPLSAFWKQISPEISEGTPKGNTSDDTPESAAGPKSPRQDVQDWNTTRLFDPRPNDSINKTLMQGLSHSNSDWNVTRSYDAKPAAPQQSIDPPRPARAGYEWVWFPAGYWAERELPDLLSPTENPERTNSKSHLFSRAAERQSHDSEDSTSPKGSRRFWGSFSSKVAKQYSAQSFKGSIHGSAISSSKSEKFLNTLQSISPTYPRYVSPSGELEGLYNKTKRNLIEKRHLAVPFSKRKKIKAETPPVGSSGVTSSTTHTARVLEGVVGYFDIHTDKIHGEPPTTASSNTSDGSKRRWRFGAPWHRRLSDHSISATSSICDLLAGKTPMGTPKSGSRYIGTAGKSYVKVEISDHDAPTFLPSEAQRHDTPQWSPKRERRGFLPNIFPYESEHKVSDKPSIGGTRPRRDTNRSALRNLLKTPTLLTPGSRRESSDSEKCSTLRGSSTVKCSASQHIPKAQHFELNVPDHLPNSPLCPANPLHTSKGQGICPLHGRGKSRGPSPNTSRSHTPDIEIVVTASD
ncbi:hypothetical protein EAF04_008774 [Stromatinia cepivora]|nr:hypothetical protein EAF04_008774 [Stromatinia cepivora]